MFPRRRRFTSYHQRIRRFSERESVLIRAEHALGIRWNTLAATHRCSKETLKKVIRREGVYGALDEIPSNRITRSF